MKNKKGFTLIELLAVMVILGLILGVAIPNVIRILNNSRNDTYINDSKNLLSLAEYKYRSGKDIQKPTTMNCVLLSLEYLDNSEFEHAPHGGTYDKKRSYVAIRTVPIDDGVQVNYYVTLVEKLASGEYQGVQNQSISSLNDKEDRNILVEKKSESSFPEVKDISYIPGSGKGIICMNIEKKY